MTDGEQVVDEDEPKVRLEWYCGLWVGEPRWLGTEWKEPGECGCSFQTEHPKSEVDAGRVFAKCPRCGGTLNWFDDSPDVVKVLEDVDG